VAPAGSADAPCTRDDPCGSLERAYAEAQPGDVVLLAAGTYGNQVLPLEEAKTPGRVVFRPAPGARVRLGDVEVRARGVTLERVTVTGWSTHDTADGVTFRDVTVRGGIFVNSSSNVAVLGGSVGPGVDFHPQIASDPPGAPSTDILIDGVTFHDWTRTSTDVHTECLLVAGVRRLTIRNSRFRNCSVFALSLGEFNGSGPPRDVTIENNFFDGTTDGFFTLHFNTNTSRLENVLVRYNSAAQGFYHANDVKALAGVRFVGNVAPANPWDCNRRVEYRHNVWDGAACGPTDVNAAGGFAAPARSDLHLRAGARAVGAGDPDSFPAEDIDGDPRPRDGIPDAGADERP
jgi:hypothetical protein